MEVFVMVNKDGMKRRINKCREELINKQRCDKGSASTTSNCECECDKSCDTGEYLDYKNCNKKISIRI